MKLLKTLNSLSLAIWVVGATAVHAQSNASAPPPAAPPQRTAAELEKLVAPIGATASLLKKGQTITVPPGALLEFTLSQPLSVRVAQ